MAVTSLVDEKSGVLGTVLKVISPGIAAAGVASLVRKDPFLMKL